MKATGLAILLMLFMGCSAAAPPSPSPSPTPSPTPTPSPAETPLPTDGRRTPPPSRPPQPSPTARPTVPPGGFLLTVLPAEAALGSLVAIPGEEVCFLVTADGGQGAVSFALSAENAAVSSAAPDGRLQPGETVGEACVVVDAAATESTVVAVTITASRAGFEQVEQRTIAIMDWPDDRGPLAQPYFEQWVAWLASAHPEYGISAATEWQPRYVKPVLIVSHYAYWSADWEMVISWHNMIPPYDFTEVRLRHRFTESGYSAAFRIDSVVGESEPRPIPPDDLMR